MAFKLLFAAAQDYASCEHLYTDTNFDGNDITYTDRDSADDCVADCKKTPGCKLFTYYNGQCWLKGVQAPASPSIGATSCVFSSVATFDQPATAPFCQLQYNVDFSGADIGSTVQANAYDCTKDCINNYKCNAYVWYNGNCWLKSAVGNQTASSGRVGCSVFGNPLVNSAPHANDAIKNITAGVDAKFQAKVESHTSVGAVVVVGAVVAAVAAVVYKRRAPKKTEERKRLLV
ncbi:Aste57867_23778 [Aphanomyces stellatus]|uniref:Aste57867_23778 protein n=1 Tax=Aphanomyces stellatus TaxID=120398 RepID=A0A485LNR5_9STRA|nr:hypothetical protein As57867_023705 [Aphanomyces stellatus]VFU00423.1 Aste57867_23778 [Aphanomyces stellatus]